MNARHSHIIRNNPYIFNDDVVFASGKAAYECLARLKSAARMEDMHLAMEKHIQPTALVDTAENDTEDTRSECQIYTHLVVLPVRMTMV